MKSILLILLLFLSISTTGLSQKVMYKYMNTGVNILNDEGTSFTIGREKEHKTYYINYYIDELYEIYAFYEGWCSRNKNGVVIPLNDLADDSLREVYEENYKQLSYNEWVAYENNYKIYYTRDFNKVVGKWVYYWRIVN